MIVIYKYNIDITDGVQTLRMHHAAKIIHVGRQFGSAGIMLWAVVDDSDLLEDREFRVVATGETLGYSADELALLHHIGTVVIHTNGLVWHVFEVGEPASAHEVL